MMKDWLTWGYLGLGGVICVVFLTAVSLGWETGWKMSSLLPSRRSGYSSSSHRYGYFYSASRGRTGGSGGFLGSFGGK
jgi:hypothetical protein